PVWMANLLAYRALSLFASAPSRDRLATTGWSIQNGEDVFTWPLWVHPIGLGSIRSLLLLPDMYKEQPDRTVLSARDVQAVFRARRIQVGEGANFKINFSPSRQV